MSELVQGAAFGTTTTFWADTTSAHALPGQTGIGNVYTMLLDDLRAQAGSGAAMPGLRVQVLTLPLTRPTRRRVRLTLRGKLMVTRLGEARASVSCESRRMSTHVIGRTQSDLPGGALPTSERNVAMTFTLPRSVRPRTSVRLVIFLEVDATSSASDAEAVVECVDIEAL